MLGGLDFEKRKMFIFPFTYLLVTALEHWRIKVFFKKIKRMSKTSKREVTAVEYW